MTLSNLKRLVIAGAALLFTLTAHAGALTSDQLKTLTEKADAGDLAAKVELADRYYTGDGVPQNYDRAAKLFTALANDGVANAQMTLAMMYIRGEGIAKDDKQAIHWLTQAAEQRLAPAQYFLGVAYADGHGVEANNVTAYMWYEIAAAMDYKNAVDATQALAKKMSEEEILKAEQQATEWWMRFHH